MTGHFYTTPTKFSRPAFRSQAPVGNSRVSETSKTILATRRLLRIFDLFTAFFEAAFSLVKQLAESVSKFASSAIRALEGAAQLLATGSLDERIPLAQGGWRWNMDPSGGTTNSCAKPVDFTAGIKCEDCFASLDFKIEFRLKIEAYNIVLVSAIASGIAEVSVAIKVFAQAVLNKEGRDKQIAKVSANRPITFSIGGVPVVIDIEVPIIADWGVELNANINVGVGFSMKGTVAYGFEYKPSESPTTALISERDFRQEYSVNQISGTANLAMRASIMPVMNIRVQGFGGPSVGLKAMLQFALKADSSKPECELSAALNLDLSLSIGAFLKIGLPGTDINIFETTISPQTIYHVQKPLIEGCVAGGGRRKGSPSITPSANLQQLSQLKVGMVWEGTQTQGPNWGTADCAMFPAYRQISMQVLYP